MFNYRAVPHHPNDRPSRGRDGRIARHTVVAAAAVTDAAAAAVPPNNKMINCYWLRAYSTIRATRSRRPRPVHLARREPTIWPGYGTPPLLPLRTDRRRVTNTTTGPRVDYSAPPADSYTARERRRSRCPNEFAFSRRFFFFF